MMFDFPQWKGNDVVSLSCSYRVRSLSPVRPIPTIPTGDSSTYSVDLPSPRLRACIPCYIDRPMPFKSIFLGLSFLSRSFLRALTPIRTHTFRKSYRVG